MKPDQEMHVAMEEPDLEPCDLFVDIGLLIIEGRTPLPTSRGYGEGPHCQPPYPSAGQKAHGCKPLDPQCIQQENFRKHMLLLWKNNIPMSIEVLLCPECCYKNDNSGEATAGPEPSYILLEQWTVQMLPRRAPEANITARAILQAVRSYLHFSQLSAWYSVTAGKAPKNVLYRVCVPGEVFSNKFSKLPDEHVFPMANVSWNNVLKVSVKTIPRSCAIPHVTCPLHDPVSPFSIPCRGTRKSPPLDVAGRYSPDEMEKLRIQRMIPARMFDSVVKKDGSPSEIMLGDSLLDPPQLLEMYPKRYQSPSRSGSPVMETPEHWMFGGRGRRGRTPHRHSPIDEKVGASMERGRHAWRKTQPIDRPMSPSCDKEEAFTKGKAAYSKKFQAYGSDVAEDDVDLFGAKGDMGPSTKSCYPRLNKSMYKLSSEETVQFLQSIVQRQPLRKNESCTKLGEMSPLEKISAISPKLWGVNSDCMKSSSSQASGANSYDGKECDELNKMLQRTKFESCPSNKPIPETNQNIKRCVWVKGQGGLPLSPLVYNSTSSCPNNQHKMSDNQAKSPVQYHDANHCSEMQMPSCKLAKHFKYAYKQNGDGDSGKLYKEIGDVTGDSPILSNLNSDKLGKTMPNWNITKSSNEEKVECRLKGLVKNDTFQQDLMDNQQNGSCETSWIDGNDSSKCMMQRYIEDEYNSNVDNASQCRKEVPSASDKAKFRRSLDSAANLVFHSRNGLPLTSSPAPMRKGTRFDFDSSLNSVSAIKKALFEKEDIIEKEDAQKILSTSAPSPVTNNSNLLGNFEESVLNGRLEPVSTVEGFTAEIGASGSFCPRHIILPVTVFFYTLSDADKVSTPYLGHINLGKKGYHVPKSGTIQVTLFNPHGTVVKMFVVMYDLRDMHSRSQTFLRQRTLYMPMDATDEDPDARKWLRYLIHLRFASSKSGRIYLHTDIRIVIFRKSDMDAATIYGKAAYELRSFTRGPTQPRFSPRR